MDKREIRKAIIERQRSMPPAERAAKSRQIADTFFEECDLTSIRSIHCFIAIEKFNEIDTTAIFRRLWNDHPQIKTFVPRVNTETDEIESLRYRHDTRLEQNFWGIFEPLHNELVAPGVLDMILVPGLAIDAAGYRVGYGKGYYDRFLARCRPDCKKIGLSYFPPVERIDDTYSGDIRLDHSVTPSGRFAFRS